MHRPNSFVSFRAYIYATLAMLFWGLSFVWFKLVIVQYRPITIIFLRLIFSGLILIAYMLVAKTFQKIQWKDLKWFMLLAFTQPFCYFLGESFGLRLVSPSLSAVIISTIPLFSPVAAYLIVREKVTRDLITGIVFSFIGIILMLVNPDFTFNAPFSGVILLFAAVVAAVAYSVVIRKIPAHYNASTIIMYQNLIGAAYFLPLFMIFDFQDFIHIVPQRKVLVALFELAFFASTFSYLFYIISIREIGIIRANVLTNLIPVFTAIFSYFVLSEQFSWLKIAGMVVVLLGIVVSQLRSIRQLMLKQ